MPFCQFNNRINEKFFYFLRKISYLICVLSIFTISSVKSEEKINAITDQIQIIMQDLKTLEKAVYKSSDVITSSSPSNNLNEDVLTKHLLKLNDIEDQFRQLTNKFEEINFKMDKLTKRVSKIQSDTQLRFDDLETVTGNTETSTNKKIKKNNNKTSWLSQT